MTLQTPYNGSYDAEADVQASGGNNEEDSLDGSKVLDKWHGQTIQPTQPQGPASSGRKVSHEG